MKKKQTHVSTDKNLEKQALSQFSSGKYKEAITLYKKLLKDSDNSEWRQQLAFCYLQRALAFAAKGMYKDALVLWENYSQHVQTPFEAYDHYFTWLIQTKNPARSQTALEQLSSQQLDKQYPALAALLGLLILTENPEFQQALPQDSVFITHLQIAQTALQAYQNSNLEGVNEALKQLPFRSAFKDFRTLLKASIAIADSITQAQSLLAKIPCHSPYSQSAGMLLACTQKGSALAQNMAQFSHKQHKIIGKIKGLNNNQFKFIDSLAKQKKPLSDKIQFKLAIQFQSLFRSELAQQFCSAMLTKYPAGLRDFNKRFDSVNAFEENRLKALSYEHNKNSADAEFHWHQCIKALKTEDAENAFKIALILRHMATKQQALEQTQTLIESLEHDPEDRACYLQILDYYSQQQETADSFKQWLKKSVAKFPQDIAVLTLAVQTAARNKTYQKASQYALKILTIDPLNTFAKQTLFSSHLAHARQLLQGKKFHLVEQEIQKAENMKISKDQSLQTQLMRGFLGFASQDKQQALQQIPETLIKLNSDPINTHFQATMEALLASLPVATILRELPSAKEHLLSAQELTRFTQLLKQYALEEENLEQLHKALGKIKAPLKKSLKQQDYDEHLLLTFCQILETIEHFELLRHCSKLALHKWQKPIWMYYQVFSETHNDPEQCSYTHILRLEYYYDKARLDNDHRAMILIGNYLNRYHDAASPSNPGILDDVFGFDQLDDFEDPFTIFDHIPDEVYAKLQKKITSLMKKTSPEKLVQELSDIVGDSSIIFHAISQNPDLFMALIILKAADTLGIDIDVNVTDVLERFGVDKNTAPIPF